MITRARLKELLHYDPITGRWTWIAPQSRRMKVGDEAGYQFRKRDGFRGSEFRRINVGGRGYRSSHLAWFYMRGRWPRRQIDHKNTNGLDDSWSNLRLATQSQNCANKRCYKTNKFGFKGVHAHHKKYRAMIQSEGKRINLGDYDSPELAYAAYAAAAPVMHGDFARV